MYMWLLMKFLLLKKKNKKTKKQNKTKTENKRVVFNLSNWNDNLKSVKPITLAILHMRLYTSEFELKSL